MLTYHQRDRVAINREQLGIEFQSYFFRIMSLKIDYRMERRQVVFLCWMQDSNPDGLWNRISSRLNARWQTDWSIEYRAKNLNSTARLYDQRAFSPLDPAAGWHSHLALAKYMFVVVNFDALQLKNLHLYYQTFVAICTYTFTNVCAWAKDHGTQQLYKCPFFYNPLYIL